MRSQKTEQGGALRDQYPSPQKAWTATILLTVVFIFSFIDRQILNLLVGPIQEDLDLTDTQMSLLQGVGFVATYVILSIPIGRLVDTRNRIGIIAWGIAIWSVATAACGLAKSFFMLFTARAGVGIGEATLTPATWSLLADYFPPHKRSLPFSIFLMGPYLGVGAAMIIGSFVMGVLNDYGPVELIFFGTLSPWQMTFLIVAAPGAILAILVLMLVEPKRQGISLQSNTVTASHKEIIDWLTGHKRIYAALLLGVPCIVLILYALQSWIPTYLLRVHGMSLQDAGNYYGTIALLFGSAGVLSGPFLGGIFTRMGYRDSQLRVAILSLVLLCPTLLFLASSPTVQSALICISIASFLVPLPLALIATALQEITPNQMRGVFVGIYVVTTNVVGLALGPSLVAIATDFVFQDPMALGKSLALIGATISVLGVFLIGSGMRQFRELSSKLK